MKKLLAISAVILLGVALGSPAALSGENPMPGPVSHSADFETMKALVGTWEGSGDMGKGVETFKVTYELTSAGSAILERTFAGSPHEMVTVYHDSGGKLAMTHYCSLGNQPRMEVKKSGTHALDFVLAEKNNGLSSVKETHMHALTITFDGKDAITQQWTLYDKGEKKSGVVLSLKRAKI